MSFSNDDAAHTKACATLRECLRSADAPLVVITGNTLSSIAWLYQHLDEVCATVSETCTVRLVSHEAALKGYLYCESHLAYTEFPPQWQASSPRTPSTRAQAFTQSLPLCCSGASSSASQGPAELCLGAGEIIWIVPRVMDTHWSGLDELVARWPAHVPHRGAHSGMRARFVWFVNTDLLTHDERTPWATPATRVDCSVHWAHLAHSPFRHIQAALRPHFPLALPARRGVAAQGTDSADPPNPTVPRMTMFVVIALRAATLLKDAHRLAALTDTAGLRTRVPDVLADCASAAVCADSASASSRDPVALPCAGAVARHEQRLRLHNMAAALAHTAQHRDRRVRAYYPRVAHVGKLLASSVCLSPLFVFAHCPAQDDVQDSADADATAAWGQATETSACRPLHDDCAARLRSLLSGAYPSATCGDLAADVLQVALRQLVRERQAWVWSVTDPLEPQVLRCTVCLSYEVFPWSGFLLPSRDGDATSPEDSVADASTMEHSLQRVLSFFRSLGWCLVYQASHDAWLSEMAPKSLQGAAARPSAATDLSSRVQHLLATQRGLQLESVADLSRALTPGMTRLSDQEETASRPAPSPKLGASPTHAQTHPLIWQAALVCQGDGLLLWQGIVVTVPSGERGTVVGFAPAPADRPCESRHRDSLADRAYDNLIPAPPSWQPALPLYVSEMETVAYPLVELHASRGEAPRRVLILPREVVQVAVPYPTTCFVSAAHLHRHHCPATHAMATRWTLPRSPEDDVVTLVRLPLRLAYFVDAASLFMALVLRHGLFLNAEKTRRGARPGLLSATHPSHFSTSRRPSRRTWTSGRRPLCATSSASTTLPPQRSEWVRMHQQPLPPTSLQYGALPDGCLLTARWSVPMSAFAGHPLRLRCALACVCAAKACRRL